MFVFLPLLSFVLLFLFLWKQGNCWRSSAILAAMGWGLLITLFTEILSLFGFLTFSGLLAVWTVTNAGLFFVYFRTKAEKQLAYADGYPDAASELTETQKSTNLTPFLRVLVGCVIAIVLIIGFTALVAPPNNWDSMTYHLARAAHWAQNHTVDHYPTAISRQLYQGPWAGFLVTQLQILSGGDRFAALVQWFCMVGSVIGVSLIAQQLGAGLRGQVFASVVCATIPMGILQASSTQTDYVGSFWLVCIAYSILLTIQDKWNAVHFPKVGASLGLAILAKGTCYVYAFPFFVWLAISGIKRLGLKIWQPALVIGGVALAINSGYYWRNYSVFGSVLGASDEYKNQVFGIRILISNVVRNMALHMSTPVRSVNLVIIKAIELLHNLMGVDVSDPRTTFPPGQQFDLQSVINHEDLAGNPLHLLLLLFCIGCFLIARNKLRTRQQYFLAAYFLAIVAAFLLFCLILVWSPWRSRLHLPIFVLLSAFLGVVLSELIKPKLANSIAVVLLSFSLLWVFMNESRPLVFNSQLLKEHTVQNVFNMGRMEQYFINRPKLQATYVSAAQFLKSQSCSNIGLSFDGGTWEYPLWVLLRDDDSKFRIEHLHVENDSSAKLGVSPYKEFVPCAILAIETEDVKQAEVTFKKQVLRRQWSEKGATIFLKNSVSFKPESVSGH